MKHPKRQIIQDSFEDYERMHGITWEMLAELNKSPKHLKHAQSHGGAKDKLTELEAAINLMFWEPNEFLNQYIFFDRNKMPDPNGHKSATVNKPYCKKWNAQYNPNNLKKVLENKDYAHVVSAYEELRNNKRVLNLFKDSPSKVSLYWTDEVSEAKCKARVGAIRTDGSLIFVKPTTDASPQRFTYEITDRSWHLEFAFALRGLSNIQEMPLDTVYVIAIEKIQPYAIGIYTIDKETILETNNKIDKLLAIYRQARKERSYGGYESIYGDKDGVHELKINPRSI